MKKEKGVLFLFTKGFPFGTLESYLSLELDLLASAFQKVIVIPAEFFGDSAVEPRRPMPDNFEILHINEAATRFKGKIPVTGLLPVMVKEFFFEKRKLRFVTELKRYFSILKHQALLAAVLEEQLKKYADYRICYYTYWLHNPAILLGLLKRKKLLTHFISRAHSIDLYHNDWPQAYAPGVKVLPFQYFKTSMCSAVYSISRTGESYLKAKFPGMEGKFFTSYLGIADRGEGYFDIDSKFTMVSCSQMTENKRVSSIAKIFSSLPFAAKWIHFGTGVEESKVKQIISSLPAHLEVELPGYVPNEMVLDFYKNNSVNLFVNLSRVEGIPVSMMEAASFGIPLLATNVFGNSEVVNTNSGFLIDENFSVDEVQRQIIAFANDKELQSAMRREARRFCLKHFERNTNLKNFISDIQKWQN